MELFYSNPNRSFYVREITRKIDEQINSVRRELSNLLNIGIITSDTNNNKLYYLAVAYRYGWDDESQYIVDVDEDEKKILYVAENEANDSGGKYGVEVVKIQGDVWDGSQESIAYFPSVYGEAKPRYCWASKCWERVGREITNIENIPDDLTMEIDAFNKAVSALTSNY